MNIYLIFLILIIIIGVISYFEKRKYQQKLFKKYKLPKKFGLLDTDLFVYNKKYKDEIENLYEKSEGKEKIKPKIIFSDRIKNKFGNLKDIKQINFNTFVSDFTNIFSNFFLSLFDLSDFTKDSNYRVITTDNKYIFTEDNTFLYLYEN